MSGPEYFTVPSIFISALLYPSLMWFNKRLSLVVSDNTSQKMELTSGGALPPPWKLKNLLLSSNVTLSAIFFCPHTPEDECGCRKPASGLLDQITEELDIDLTGVHIVGDSLRDLQAGLKYNCSPILVRTGKGSNTEIQLKKEQNLILKQTRIFDDLACVADYLCDG